MRTFPIVASISLLSACSSGTAPTRGGTSHGGTREEIPRLVADAHKELMEPYFLAGEKSEALHLRIDEIFAQNSDEVLLKKLEKSPGNPGELDYFMSEAGEKRASHPKSMQFIEARTPPRSHYPALRMDTLYYHD